MEIEPKWQTLHEQTISDSEGNVWNVAVLVDLAKNLPVFEIPLKHLCVAEKTIGNGGLLDFVRHMKQVMGVDKSYPIILDEYGSIFDGRHRVARALFDGDETIKAVRFEKDPPPTYKEPK